MFESFLSEQLKVVYYCCNKGEKVTKQTSYAENSNHQNVREGGGT